MKKKLKKLARVLIVLSLLVCVVAALTLYVMARKDKMHARFYNTGKSINKLLSDYNHALKDAFNKKDTAQLIRFYSDSYSSPARGRWVTRRDNDESDVACYRLIAEGADDYDKTDLRDELAGYFAGLASIEDIKLKIDMIERVELDRSVALTVKFILDGHDREGALFQDRHFYRWHLVNEDTTGADYDWKIVKDELVEGVRVAGDGRGFVELDSFAVGIDYKHQRDPKLNVKSPDVNLKFGVMEHGFGGVSATDYNNDGRPDVFFADGRRCRLYRNDSSSKSGGVSFSDITTEAGLDGIDQANAGIFADVDNDGHQDLFVARYLAPCLFFHNNGDGTFTDQSKDMGLNLVAPCMSACFLDYDRDGYVDIYVGVYGNAFTDIPRLPFFAQNGGADRLFHNNGGHKFTDVTEASGTGDTGWGLAVAACDYDNDGYPDLMVANDFGRKNLYHNNGDGTFSEVAKQAGVLDFSGGMGLAFGDFDDDGNLDVYTSNINSNQRWFGEDMTVDQYFRNVLRTKYALTDAGEYWKVYKLLGPQWTEVGTMIGEGNSLFHNNGDGTFTELKDSHTNRAGWGWSVAFFDMDNDTKLDIYAANGWISNKPDTDL
jgi:hypothetical protein